MRKVGFTTKCAMILCSPAENENGGISFHRVPSSTRHSRARGNPGLLRRISLDTRFRGYDGTQAGLLVLIPKRVFSKEITKDTKVSEVLFLNFVLFVSFVVVDTAGRISTEVDTSIVRLDTSTAVFRIIGELKAIFFHAEKALQ